MVKRKGRRGQKKRKSARILALEASRKAKKQNASNDTQQQNNASLSPPQSPPYPAVEGVAESRKGRKKKRLDEVAGASVGPTTQQPQHGEQPKLDVPPVNGGMPGIRILEFILDILQRRDTHEIFAQPVDPDEVEGYYSIIEKPMDFGTMRAKLQEGMYSTFDQFESDVFLITNNAMLFNSSATIYFRQARAIHELAKRVFHTLKTDPERVELEFSLTRGRHGRKPQGETGGSHVKIGPKLRRNSLAYCGSFGANPHDDEILPGSRDGRNASFCESERRQTYNPQTSLVSEESLLTPVHISLKQLVPGNGGIGYKESLLRFVKDLGPIAQKVANEKLRWLTQTPNHSIHDSSPPISSSAAQRRPNYKDGIINGLTMDINNPLGNHGTTSKGKSIVINDHIDVDTSACGGNKMVLGIGGLDLSKGKGVLIGDGGISHSSDHNTLNQLCSEKYMAMDGMLGSRQVGDLVQMPHCVSRSPPGLLEFLSSTNSRPKSSVYPSKVIKASGLSQANPSMHEPGKESDASMDPNSRPSLGRASQPLQWTRPLPWGPQAVDDFPRIQPQIGEVDQYLAAMPRNMSQLGQDVFPRQQMQPQPSLVNLLGHDAFGPLNSQIPVASYSQPLASDVNPDHHPLQGHQPNSNGQFWNFEQEFLRGNQDPDLALRLRTQNRRA